MGAKAMDASGNTHAAESFAPSYRIGLPARFNGQRVGGFRPPSHDPVDLFLDVDQRLLHHFAMLGWPFAGCKQQEMFSRQAGAVYAGSS
jgi:hypothetical protein